MFVCLDIDLVEACGSTLNAAKILTECRSSDVTLFFDLWRPFGKLPRVKNKRILFFFNVDCDCVCTIDL